LRSLPQLENSARSPIIDFYVKPLWRKQQSFLRYTE
jgi:hypothetical protein